MITGADGSTVTSRYATLHIGEKKGEMVDVMISIPGVEYESNFKQYLVDQHAAGTPVTIVYKLDDPTVKEDMSARCMRLAPGYNSILTPVGVTLDATVMMGGFAAKVADMHSKLLETTSKIQYGTEMPSGLKTGDVFILLR